MRSIPGIVCLSLVAVFCACVSAAPAEEKITPEAKQNSVETVEKSVADFKEEILPGHSNHGHAFDTGPRQSAYLMGNTANVHFPVTTNNPEVQKLFDQGLGQLHGFWFFEAERSFRQAAALDPDCAIAYWGMAMSNESNEERAKEFIAKAGTLKEKASRYEQMWIQALHDAYHKEYKEDKESKKRWQAYVSALEEIVHEFPEDVEPKAFLALHLFWNKSGKALGVTSRTAVNALLSEVFEKSPMHPSHHYRIHLWDRKKPARALKSAALCGQAAPSIAHMWHMSGHIYSGVKRYEDAAWQQEASSRVDHYHMVHDRVLPTEIHNYTHNQEWFTRNLIIVGRIRDALSISRNLVELPRHPKHNSPTNGSSAVVRGRTRLLDVLIQFELWDELITLAETPYLAVDDSKDAHVRKVRYLAVANFAKGNANAGQTQLKVLEDLLGGKKKEVEELTKKLGEKAVVPEVAKQGDKPVDVKEQAKAKEAEKKKREEARKADEKNKKEIEKLVKNIEKAVAHVQGQQAGFDGDHKKSLELFKKAGDLPKTVLARAHFAAGSNQEAEKLAKQAVAAKKNEVYPLAVYAKLLYDLNKKKESKKAFEQLREISALIDIDMSIFAELEPLAIEFGYTKNWLREYKHREDTGIRPELETLGPLTWHPTDAPAWELKNSLGKPVKLADYQGKPVVVIFYLGFGCLHCVEQLGAFSPVAEEYRQAGIDIVAVGSDELTAIQSAIADYSEDKTLNFPLLSDANLEIFEKYRCVDNFENQALHGTFLIGANGKILWQDIGPEPFTDTRFLLKESQRLLKLSSTTNDKKPGVVSSGKE